MTAAPRLARASGAVRVLIVDDSAVVRGLTTQWLRGAPDITIAGLACDGEEGVKKAGELKPDVVILDVEMPKLDGLAALPQILKAAPDAKVIMASTLTRRNADITMQALAAGAADYLPKPETGRLASAADYQRDLVAKVRGLGSARAPRAAHAAASAGPSAAERAAFSRKPTGPLAAFSKVTPRALVIGSSTGGPQALQAVVRVVGAGINAPVLIAQHMPATFTSILAGHLDKLSPMKAVEGANGMPVRPGMIYVAPGNYHMTAAKRAGSVVIQLDQRPPENFCRPAVDPLFRSAAATWGPELLGVVLTGMGHDGALGSQEILRAGGSVIAQDEATSVVWGMPGAVAAAGAACAIEPLGQIGQSVVNLFNGKRR